MVRIPIRRAVAAFVTAAIATVTTLVVGAAPAHAAASGVLLMKGTGSVYTANNGVNLGVTPGQGTKTFSFKVVNTGTSNQQFKVTVDLFGPGFSATLFSGYQAVASPFTTPPVRPGGNVVLNLKLAVDAGEPPSEYVAALNLLDPETDVELDSAFADANATYQTGTTQHDLFLKTGSQPYVGGSVAQFETAPALRPGQTAQFTIRLKNNGASPASMTLQGFSGILCPDEFVWSAKAGFTNVTGAVEAGTYSTGILNPGAKKELKISIKLLADPDPACTADYFFFEATGADGSIGSAAHVVIAA